MRKRTGTAYGHGPLRSNFLLALLNLATRVLFTVELSRKHICSTVFPLKNAAVFFKAGPTLLRVRTYLFL